MIGHLKNVLVNEGFDCFTKNDYLTGAIGELPLNECWLEIWITEDSQYDKAKEIIKNAFTTKTSTRPRWRCSDCGEEHEPQFTECWNCGKNRP